MSGNSRKRSSKWDLREELESKQLRPSWSSRDSQRRNGSKWSYMEEADKMSSENDMEFSSKENYHGSRGSHMDDTIKKDSRRAADASMAWDRDSNYGARMSRGLEERGHGSRSRSPKNILHRSVRSRSRSRSRSAERIYRRDMGARDRTRSRSGATAQVCREFVAGNCRRGSHCHFLHDGDKNYDDNRETRYRIDGASRCAASDETEDYLVRSGKLNTLCSNFARGNCRMGTSCRYVHHSVSDGLSRGVTDELTREREFDRRSIENSFEQVRQEPGRSIDTPCKFFAAGHCRNGKYCRFSHDEQAFASPKERSKDERRGHGRSDGEQVWDHPRRSENSSPKRGLRDDKRDLYHDIVDVNKVWNGPTWDEVGAGSKAAKMDTSKSMNPPKSGSTSWPVNDQWDHKLEGNIKVISKHTTESGKEESNQWEMQKAGVSMNLTDARSADKWISDVDMSPDWHYKLESSNFVSKEEHAQSKSNLPGEVTYLTSHNHDRTDTLPGQSFSQNRQLLAPGTHAIVKNQAIVPDIPSTGNYLEGAHGKLGYADTQGNIQPNVGKASPLQVNSTIPPTQNTVSNDQLSQLTNLSASLVHLLGKGQQLPQLYGTLDSHDSKTDTSFGNTGGPREPASSNTIHPDPTTGMQKQHDPVCNRIETKNTDAVAVPPTSSHNSVGQKEVLAEKLERHSLTPISDKVGDRCNVGNADERKSDKSEWMTKSQLVKQCENTTENNVAMVDGGKTVQDDDRREKKNVTSENMERDGDTDEDKKIKDSKVTRAFKFALVEFVKELLKPTWKEGKITKEGYKTIVKKVVDKVTGSLQANHIPQTQEKIDQYLSFSKAKLNKLVQAYVEKVQKA